MTQPAQAPFTLDAFARQVENFVTGVLTLDPEQAALRAGLTLLVIIGAVLLIWGLRLLFKTLLERIAPAEEGAPPRKRLSIGRWTLRVARFAIVAAALLVILRVWGFDFSVLRDSPIGDAFAVATRIAIILVIAFAAIELAQIGITQMFARVAKRARNARRAAQVRTLGPLLTGVVTTTLIVIAAMMTLSEFGVEIGPLIAGAGIVGLAVGFGAQTLVKDFLTGIFLIIEDSVSIGDVVMIANFGGVVEDMSLRTIKLRDFDGTLHIFPYSEAQVIHNRTKNFSYAVFELTIDYAADVGRALEVMKRTGAVLRTDEAFMPHMLDDIDVVGVDKVADGAVTLKARIKTLPGKQWAVQREYLMRVWLAFEAAGIEMPSRTMKLLPPDAAGAG